jgi:hypothetical protein
VVAVDDGRSSRPWRDLGVHAVLPAAFQRQHLADALRAVARPIARGDGPVLPTGPQAEPPGAWRGALVAVTGAGGVGRSTAALALAAGLAADPRDRGLVLLADLALHAQQALLHDAGDVVPGLPELVEAHRGGALGAAEVRSLCFAVPGRGYDLLLGLRRHRDWTALRPRAFDAALLGLRRAYRTVVADVDADVEGEAQCGSTDVEDRNLLARHTLGDADLVLVVGLAGVAGAHSQLRVLRDVVELGVPGERIVPVVNRAPRNPRPRSEAGATLARLLAATAPATVLATSPLFLPERRRVADVLRDNAPAPAALVRPLAGAVRGLLDGGRQAAGGYGSAGESPVLPAPVQVVPGSLGSWTEEEVGSA